MSVSDVEFIRAQARTRAAETILSFNSYPAATEVSVIMEAGPFQCWVECLKPEPNTRELFSRIHVRKDKKQRPVYEESSFQDEDGRVVGTSWRFQYFRFGISETRMSQAVPVAIGNRRISPRHNRRAWSSRTY